MRKEKLENGLSHLQSTYAMLQCAFPEGVPEALYLPLLAVLSEHMSQRSLAKVIEAFTEKDYAYVYNDVLYVLSTELTELALQTQVQALLRGCGYQAWLQELYGSSNG
jgi:hypothetical protein